MALRQLATVTKRSVTAVSQRSMASGEKFVPSTGGPANIVKSRELLCSGGTWLGAGGPTFLKGGSPDVMRFYASGAATGIIILGVLSGLVKMTFGIGKTN